MAPRVDIHCHTFNATDIPVDGFFAGVLMTSMKESWRPWVKRIFGDDLDTILDQLVDEGTPGFAAENQRLDRLLDGVPPLPARHEPGDVPAVERPEDGRLALDRIVAANLDGDEIGPFGLIDDETIRRFVEVALNGGRFASLLRNSRLMNTLHLIEAFGDGIDVYCPLLVDLDTGLTAAEGRRATTSLKEQMILHEKISRLSIVGRLPFGTAKIHPFMAFDPLRERRARADKRRGTLAGDAATPFDLVKAAVRHYGFVGVKVYPPMGWRPIGNLGVHGLSPEEATELDGILRRFYGWCLAEDVPITAHCSHANYSRPEHRRMQVADPAHWIEVLEEFEGLRLNLGHFGGFANGPEAADWPARIAEAAGDHDHLYADVGDHDLASDEEREAHFRALERMFKHDPTTQAMKDRLMYGSDWFMLTLLNDHGRFLDRYASLYDDLFGPEATADFMGGRAMRFLGFGDPGNANNRRLRRRYEYFGAEAPPWLAR